MSSASVGETRRMHVTLRGVVQGVGFRPFVYRLATSLRLVGWVVNSPEGVFLEVEGPPERLRDFLLRLQSESPPRASIQSLEYSELDPLGFRDFEIRPSEESGEKSALVMPDIAPCRECLREIGDPSNRRYQYPFTNCTNCGPRFSIIHSLPYDRPRTTMATFLMCPACRAEYESPLDRRFHAQPNACPACGPHLELWDPSGQVLAERHDALLAAAEALRSGQILALKGLGGFQLLVDARDTRAIEELRKRKHREEKPFALMFPALHQVQDACFLSPLEARLLESPESPIVLLRRKEEARRKAGLSPAIAPGNPYLGVMLPSTPLHHILLAQLNIPIIATSGNLSQEPLCTDELEALHRLAGMADLFLVHNRPIARHVDDSIVRILLGRELMLRRARGYAPLPVEVMTSLPEMLAVGPHLKNTVAVSRGHQVFLSQHIGDLETAESFDAFRRECGNLQSLFSIHPEAVVSDLHPEYLSTKHARASGGTVLGVQHHWAHVAACMAENNIQGRFLGVSWDGTGYGEDGTIWGGEFLLPEGGTFRRMGHLRTHRIPGGDASIREPRRTAAGVLFEVLGAEFIERTDLAPVRAFRAEERLLLCRMLQKGINAPLTSSAGRLFDAVAALIGIRQECSFEGQAAMELEYLASNEREQPPYEFAFREEPRTPLVVDWGPVILALLEDLHRGVAAARLAARFHDTLVRVIVSTAQKAGIERVILSGGCFQNAILTERTIHHLRAAGFQPVWHQRVPPNDGGIALGQLVAAGLASSRNGEEIDHVPGHTR